MFHVEQIINKARQISITELVYYIFVISIPIQLKLLISPASAYIGNYFIQPLALLVYFSDVLFVSLILTWVWFHRGKIDLFRSILWVLPPILWAFLNLFHVEQWSLWLYGSLKMLEFWLIMAFLKENPKVSRGTLIIVAFWTVIQSIISLFQYYLQHPVGLDFLGEYLPGVYETGAATLNTVSGKILRPYGTFPHPNVLGGFLVIGLACWLYVSRETKGLTRNFIVSCGTIAITWAVIISFSRSAWVSAGFVFLMGFAWLMKHKQFKKALILAILLIVSCGTIAITNKQALFPRFIDSGETSQAQITRNEFNLRGWEYFKKHPLTGYGAKQYIYISQTSVIKPWMNQPPHNIFLYYLTEFGLIGLVVAALFLYKLGFRWNNWDVLGLTLCGTVIILGLFDHYLISTQQTFLLFGVILGYLTNKKDVSQTRETS